MPTAKRRRDMHEEALAALRELSDFERDAWLRIMEVLDRHPQPAPGFTESMPALFAEHRAAVAKLCKLATQGWLAADDEVTHRATVSWGPDGRVCQPELRTRGKA